MHIKTKKYLLEVINDDNYTLSSADNTNFYQFSYYEHYDSQFTSKHGIRVYKANREINSALVCSSGGATTINPNSFVIKQNTLLVCCSNKVFSLGIPDLKLNWVKKLDTATCFGVYEFMDDFVVHGELLISKIDIEGLIAWQFGGKDIFLHPHGENAFSVVGNRIYLKDGDSNEYVLDWDGKEIL